MKGSIFHSDPDVFVGRRASTCGGMAASGWASGETEIL